MNQENTEIITSVQTPEAERLFELHALRQIGDQIKQMNQSMSTIGTQMTDVRERMIKLEQNTFQEDIDKLTTMLGSQAARLDTLETDKERRSGMAALFEFVSRNSMFIILLASILYFWLSGVRPVVK